MYKLEQETEYFSLVSFRQRTPGRRGQGHMRWRITVNRFALIKDDIDLDLVYSVLHPSRGSGYGHERTFKTQKSAEHMLTMLLLSCGK